jgi:regulator of replication initiation timing
VTLRDFVINSMSNALVVSATGGNNIDPHMKPKNLSKKIRRLEARLQKGAKKLTKLKQKLEAAATAGAAKKTRKSAVRADKAHNRVEISRRAEKKKRPSAAKKVKRKLNLTPERRAELAAAMKARWVAKRAAADANTQTTSTEQGFAPGQGSHPE